MASHIYVLLIGVIELRLLLSCPTGKMEADNGSCIDCQAGYFGENCSYVCEKTKYGVGCRKLCSCTAEELCDPRIGCISNSSASNSISPSTISTVTAQPEEAQLIRHLSITFAAVGFVLIVFTAEMFCQCVRERRQKKEEGQKKEDRVPTADSAGSLNAEGIGVALSEIPLYAGVSNSANLYSFSSEERSHQ